MPDVCLDSNVFIVHLLREAEREPKVDLYFTAMREGRLVVHVPRLALLEICGAIRRQLSQVRPQIGLISALAARNTLLAWDQRGELRFYDLDNTRMLRASDIAIQYALKGSDAEYVALSEELDLDFVTLDEASLVESIRKLGYPRLSRVIVP
jgi:predicted nucleic acid-binding protein